jgi:hypothetical protein
VGIGLLALGLALGGPLRSNLPTFLNPWPAHIAQAEGPNTEESQTEDVVPEAPVFIPIGPAADGIATRYGTSYNGKRMGCPGAGLYSSWDETIVAVSPGRYRSWGCGMLLEVCGPVSCVLGVRKDACPGCGTNHVDLSEAGIAQACGAGADRCRVRIQAVLVQ